jgi:mannose-6-phosphate isomerase
MLGPLKFEPRLISKPWGSDNLRKWNKVINPGERVGESWEIFDQPQASALISNGDLKGTTLNQVYHQFGPALVGENWYKKDLPLFPLLVKYIDAALDLSIQVHPDDDWAASRLGPDQTGKTEAWIILDAPPDAKLQLGLKPGVDKKSLTSALRSQKLEEVLNFITVKKSDVIFVPSGQVHAVGSGIVMAEIQQNSDVTWRLYDYNRLENGQLRELHIKPALECLDFSEAGARSAGLKIPVIKATDPHLVEELVRCAYFTVERLTLCVDNWYKQGIRNCMDILMVIDGQAELVSDTLTGMIIKKGDSLLLPAQTRFELKALLKETKILRIFTDF